MPLEIWILMMTLFNVFLVITYMYFRTLHLNTSKKFDHAVSSLDTRIKKFEDSIFSDNSSISQDKLDNEDR